MGFNRACGFIDKCAVIKYHHCHYFCVKRYNGKSRFYQSLATISYPVFHAGIFVSKRFSGFYFMTSLYAPQPLNLMPKKQVKITISLYFVCKRRSMLIARKKKEETMKIQCKSCLKTRLVIMSLTANVSESYNSLHNLYKIRWNFTTFCVSCGKGCTRKE